MLRLLAQASAEAVAPAQRYAEGGTWAEDFAGGDGGAAGDWADQLL